MGCAERWEGQVLFVRDGDRLCEVAFRTDQAFEDLKTIYDRYQEDEVFISIQIGGEYGRVGDGLTSRSRSMTVGPS